jgi:hypothetical protein
MKAFTPRGMRQAWLQSVGRHGLFSHWQHRGAFTTLDGRYRLGSNAVAMMAGSETWPDVLIDFEAKIERGAFSLCSDVAAWRFCAQLEAPAPKALFAHTFAGFPCDRWIAVRVLIVGARAKLYLDGALAEDVQYPSAVRGAYRFEAEADGTAELRNISVSAAHPWDLDVQSPPRRQLRPVDTYLTWPYLYDYVECGDAVSASAHALDASPGGGIEQETLPRQHAGAYAGSYFSYVLSVPSKGQFFLRVDETGGVGDAVKDYAILVNGQKVHDRSRKIHTGWQGQCWGGCATYVVEVPDGLTPQGTANIRFQSNSANTGSQPTIASIWAVGEARAPSIRASVTLPANDALMLGGTIGFKGGEPVYSKPYCILDFGKSVSGILSFAYQTDAPVRLKVAFSNSRLYAGEAGDTQSPDEPARDDAFVLTLDGQGRWRHDTIRGAFRYVGLYLLDSGDVALSDIGAEDVATAPLMEDLTDYAGYFHSDDDRLNRLWYAAAYTAQLCTSASDAGNGGALSKTIVTLSATICTSASDAGNGGASAYSWWASHESIGPGMSCLTDAGKRDRWIWDADLAVAMPIAFLSMGDFESTRNALEMCFGNMNEAGRLKDYSLGYFSDAYHVYGLYAFTEYLQYTADDRFLHTWWAAFEKAMNYALGTLENDLPNAGGGSWNYTEDPASTEISCLLAWALQNAARLADRLNCAEQSRLYEGLSERIANAVNARLWSESRGAYVQSLEHDDRVSTLGCVMAVLSGVAPQARAASCMAYVYAQMKNDCGYQTIDVDGGPLPKTNHVFCGSWLLKAMGITGGAQQAAAYMETTWGQMLDNPIGNQSTFWETYSTDGALSNEANDSVGHIWSCGPLQALTEYLLGLRPAPDAYGYDRYLLHPNPAGRTWMKGRIPLPNGCGISASWQTDGKARFVIELDSTGHPQGLGEVRLPCFGSEDAVFINGKKINTETPSGIGEAERRKGYTVFHQVSQGFYRFESVGKES